MGEHAPADRGLGAGLRARPRGSERRARHDAAPHEQVLVSLQSAPEFPLRSQAKRGIVVHGVRRCAGVKCRSEILSTSRCPGTNPRNLRQSANTFRGKRETMPVVGSTRYSARQEQNNLHRTRLAREPCAARFSLSTPCAMRPISATRAQDERLGATRGGARTSRRRCWRAGRPS